MEITYRPEQAADAAATERVLDAAFGPGRFAKTSERVRERGARHRFSLSRVAEQGGRLIGICRIYDVLIGGRASLFLGPLAVEPGAQHHGCGANLVRACTSAGRSIGAGAIVCVGAADFFVPLGFSLVPPGRLIMPGPVDPRRFLWAALVPGALDPLFGAVGPPEK